MNIEDLDLEEHWDKFVENLKRDEFNLIDWVEYNLESHVTCKHHKLLKVYCDLGLVKDQSLGSMSPCAWKIQ